MGPKLLGMLLYSVSNFGSMNDDFTLYYVISVAVVLVTDEVRT